MTAIATRTAAIALPMIAAANPTIADKAVDATGAMPAGARRKTAP
jgi:hypothetical protein